MACERVSIVCIGNALHGDDGVGEAVWAQLAQAGLPAHVRLHCAPFAGPALLPCFENCERVIVVDAVRGFGEAGSVHRVPADAVAAEASPIGHGVGIGHWLAQLPLWLDRVPAVELIGVEAERMAPFSPQLSAVVAAAVPTACRQVLSRLGHA